MTQKIISIIFSSFLTISANSQETVDWTKYMNLIQKADTLFQKEHFAESAMAYSNAFIFNNQHFSQGDRYNAARAWAKAGQIDSAISNLKLEIEAGFYQLNKLKKEAAFSQIKKQQDWKVILYNVVTNLQAENQKLGNFKYIKPKLENILVLDQQFRKDYYSKLLALGPGSKEIKKLLQKTSKTDKQNQKYVSKILDEHGWIDYKIIGFDASSALFLVVQHADSIFQEKYLPFLKQAVKEKKAFGHDLALLEDRVLIRRGQKQVYGSQIQCDSTGKNCWILPIEDERNVDKRRKEVGLQPLADYVKFWNIVYKQAD
jgi:hypothetical protein